MANAAKGERRRPASAAAGQLSSGRNAPMRPLSASHGAPPSAFSEEPELSMDLAPARGRRAVVGGGGLRNFIPRLRADVHFLQKRVTVLQVATSDNDDQIGSRV